MHTVEEFQAVSNLERAQAELEGVRSVLADLGIELKTDMAIGPQLRDVIAKKQHTIQELNVSTRCLETELAGARDVLASYDIHMQPGRMLGPILRHLFETHERAMQDLKRDVGHKLVMEERGSNGAESS